MYLYIHIPSSTYLSIYIIILDILDVDGKILMIDAASAENVAQALSRYSHCILYFKIKASIKIL